jgi:hypothetical protein
MKSERNGRGGGAESESGQARVTGWELRLAKAAEASLWKLAEGSTEA